MFGNTHRNFVPKTFSKLNFRISTTPTPPLHPPIIPEPPLLRSRRGKVTAAADRARLQISSRAWRHRLIFISTLLIGRKINNSNNSDERAISPLAAKTRRLRHGCLLAGIAGGGFSVSFFGDLERSRGCDAKLVYIQRCGFWGFCALRWLLLMQWRYFLAVFRH